MLYTPRYYINKFEAIPSEKWCTGHYEDYNDPTVCCAMGHCGSTASGIEPEETLELISLFSLHAYRDIVEVNDKITPEYPQLTPKERVLAALHHIEDKLNG